MVLKSWVRIPAAPGEISVGIFTVSQVSLCADLLVAYFPLCVYACRRSSTHVKDPVIHVSVRWVAETRKYPACTRGLTQRIGLCSWSSICLAGVVERIWNIPNAVAHPLKILKIWMGDTVCFLFFLFSICYFFLIYKGDKVSKYMLFFSSGPCPIWGHTHINACWVCSCFRNPPNADMDYGIVNVHVWSSACVYTRREISH